MKTEVLINRDGYKKERIILAAGEHEASAGSTKKAWYGPGSFIRETWPDGGRQDTGDGAHLTFLPIAAALLIACAAFGALVGCSGGIHPSFDAGTPGDAAPGFLDGAQSDAGTPDGDGGDPTADAGLGDAGDPGDGGVPPDSGALDGGAVTIAFAPTEANLNVACGSLGCPSHATVLIFVASDVVTWTSVQETAPSGPPWHFTWDGESYATSAHLTDMVRVDLYDEYMGITRLTCTTSVVAALADGYITCGRTGDPAFDYVTVAVAP